MGVVNPTPQLARAVGDFQLTERLACFNIECRKVSVMKYILIFPPPEAPVKAPLPVSGVLALLQWRGAQ